MTRSLDAITLGFLVVRVNIPYVGGPLSPYVAGLGPRNPLPTRFTIKESYNRHKVFISWVVSFGMGLLFGLVPMGCSLFLHQVSRPWYTRRAHPRQRHPEKTPGKATDPGDTLARTMAPWR